MDHAARSLHVGTTAALIGACAVSPPIGEATGVSTRPTRGSRATTDFKLNVASAAGASATRRRRHLTCDPSGGNHPFPQQACHDLAAAEAASTIFPGSQPGRTCNGLYAPMTATAVGERCGVPMRVPTHLRQCLHTQNSHRRKVPDPPLQRPQRSTSQFLGRGVRRLCLVRGRDRMGWRYPRGERRDQHTARPTALGHAASVRDGFGGRYGRLVPGQGRPARASRHRSAGRGIDQTLPYPGEPRVA